MLNGLTRLTHLINKYKLKLSNFNMINRRVNTDMRCQHKLSALVRGKYFSCDGRTCPFTYKLVGHTTWSVEMHICPSHLSFSPS